MNQEHEQEQVVVKFNKYSLWTQFKITIHSCFTALYISLFCLLFLAMFLTIANVFGFVDSSRIYEVVYELCGN